MAVERRIAKLKEIMDDHVALRNRLSASKDTGDQLYYRLCFDTPKSGEEWVKLCDQVHEYLHGEYPDEKKSRLRQYTEMLAMIKRGDNEIKKEGSNGKG